MTVQNIAVLLAIVSICRISAGADWVWVQQKGGGCALADFADRPDGDLEGYHTWFGRSIRVLSSFYAASSQMDGGLDTIRADLSVVSNASQPAYSQGCVAFLTASSDLVACARMIEQQAPVAPDDAPSSQKLKMPVPSGVAREATSWRFVHYESNRDELGGLAWSSTQPVQLTQHTNGKSETLSWPKWPSDGERQGKFLAVREGYRQIPSATPAGYRSEASEGTCKLQQSQPGDSWRNHFAIRAGEDLGCEVEYRLELNKENQISPWFRVKNATQNRKCLLVYLALFDAHENLVFADNHTYMDMKPHFEMPEVRAGAEKGYGFSFGGRAISIPRGIAELIASYKITVYEAEPSDAADSR